VFKNTWFTRFAAKEGITDSELLDMVNQLEAGQADANLGGGVYKIRVARSGEGKSGGYRIIVFFRNGERTFYHYGFAKSDMSNITQGDLEILKKTAKKELAMTGEQITLRLMKGTLVEIT
jgi:hypothetical protein